MGGEIGQEVLEISGRFLVVVNSQVGPGYPVVGIGRVCLLRNYRVAVDETLIELPAGTLEPGEDPVETARRELAEETGYRAAELELLAEFFTSPGLLDEKMLVYTATSLTPGPMALEPGEDIEPLLCTCDEALAMARDGRIRDGKTIAALLLWAARR